MYIVRVKFKDNKTLYSYKHSGHIAPGAKAVVDSPSGGYTVVTVKECEYSSINSMTLKPIVDIVDDREYLRSKYVEKIDIINQQISKLEEAKQSLLLEL